MGDYSENPSIDELRQRIRSRSELEDAGGNKFVPDAELLQLINTNFGYLHDLIREADRNYVASFANVQTTANVSTYGLPGDFYSLISLGLVDAAGDEYRTFRQLESFELTGPDTTLNPFFAINGQFCGTRFALVGQKLRLRPVPMQDQLLGMWYAPQAPRFASFDQRLPAYVKNGWEEYVVLRCAMCIAAKEQKGYQIHQQMSAEIKTAISKFASNRDESRPYTVQSARGRHLPYPLRGMP